MVFLSFVETSIVLKARKLLDNLVIFIIMSKAAAHYGEQLGCCTQLRSIFLGPFEIDLSPERYGFVAALKLTPNEPYETRGKEVFAYGGRSSKMVQREKGLRFY